MVTVRKNAIERLKLLKEQTGWSMGLITEAAIRAFEKQDVATRKAWVRNTLTDYYGCSEENPDVQAD